MSSTKRVQICRENSSLQHPEFLNTLRALGHKVEVEECLDECTRCETCAFALVSGRLLVAGTPEELLHTMKP